LSPEEWERVLLGATERVQRKVASIAVDGRQGDEVGVGASGDSTILADKGAEDEILSALEQVGGVRVLSEEAGEGGDREAQTLAVVDPLDGSSNYKIGIPFYCTSVAIVDAESLEGVALGVVRDLVSGDVYVGKRGAGATKNGRPIQTSGRTNLSEAVVGIDASRSPADVAMKLAPLMSSAKRQVHFGANALELCFLADGRIDAFVDIRGKIRITDFAAAYLIAKEAGATFTDEGGVPVHPSFDLHHRFSFVGSASESLHKEILRVVGGPSEKRSPH
jgi:myo-inositol-1(or 4)-monophosphatase